VKRVIFPIIALVLAVWPGRGVAGGETVPPRGPLSASESCTSGSGPEYYAFLLAATGNIAGTGFARGRAEVSFPGSSPFPVALAADGSYVYEIRVTIERMKAPSRGHLVAWITTPDLGTVARMGALDERLTASGRVSWNKYLVVVSLEAEDREDAERWSGPVVFRGMSRSGAMHTMIGHGALQQENCAAYGFGS